MKRLTSLGISFVKVLSLIGNKEFILLAHTDRGAVRIRFSGLVYLNMSNDVSDMEDDDEVEVVDCSHECRELYEKDLLHYEFLINLARKERSVFHIIKIHGNTVFEIICKEVDFESPD